jgi:hypothetical protein
VQTFDNLIDRLKDYVGVNTEIIVEYVGEIPLIRTGKRSPVVSELPLDFQVISQSMLGKD